MSAPLFFVSHGAPSIALEQDGFTRAVNEFGKGLQGIRAIVVVSAHWQTRAGVLVNAVAKPQPIYDFGGFSHELYSLRYDAPGDPVLAAEIFSLFEKNGVSSAIEHERGWDHGVWVPFRHLRPAADIPIVEISQPTPVTPDEMVKIGATLAQLREKGIAIAGSGGIVHNLRAIHLEMKDAPVDSWAAEFDTWVATHLANGDDMELRAYRRRAPHAAVAVPTPEHFDPLFVILGARAEEDRFHSIYEGFHYANLSMRSFAFCE